MEDSYRPPPRPRKEAPRRVKTGLRLGLIVSAICRYTMSRLSLRDGCQEFSLYRRDLRLTSQEGRDASEEASSELWRQSLLPLPPFCFYWAHHSGGAGKTTLTHRHSHITNIHLCTCTPQMSDWKYYEEISTTCQPTLLC